MHLSVPNLTTLILTNNNIAELGDLEPLKDVRGLKYLSLLGNPVREKKWYREWLAHRIPGLRVLDFQRIRDKVCALAALAISGINDPSVFAGTTVWKDTFPHSGQSTYATCDNHIIDCVRANKGGGHYGRT